MNVLLTGGAGYIGSHAVRALQRAGHTPVVYDNLVKGHTQAIDCCQFIHGDVADQETLAAVLGEYDIDTVIHFAAFIEAGESCAKPGKYFRNNTVSGLSLLEAMRQTDVRRLVFSSTAAVYGIPEETPIVETAGFNPISPYGSSKLCVEYMLRGYAEAYDMGFVALRYFNVAGAEPGGKIGEDHDPETHLIPLTLQVALGQREKIYIFGDDYNTDDGTCVRDYIHVCDLVDAHILAAEAIQPGRVEAFNLGNGAGFSVKQVIETCRKVTGHPIPGELAARRPGDPDTLIASSKKAIDQLGWQPKYPDLETIIAHAWEWHRENPRGYLD